MNITERREQVAGIVAAELGPDYPVSAVPPANVTPPCAFVTTGRTDRMVRRQAWDCQYVVTLMAPAGDNEAAVTVLEDLMMRVAGAFSGAFTAPGLWERPEQALLAGKPHFVANLTVTCRIDRCVPADVRLRSA